MKNAKRFLAGTLAAATAMSMMTCAQMTVSADEEISGTIEVGGWPSGDDAFEAAMEGFNEQYPNVEVELVFTDTTAHHQSLQTALAAGSGAPDVAMVEGAYIAQYRNSSALTNLYDFGAEDLKDDFVEFKGCIIRRSAQHQSILAAAVLSTGSAARTAVGGTARQHGSHQAGQQQSGQLFHPFHCIHPPYTKNRIDLLCNNYTSE